MQAPACTLMLRRSLVMEGCRSNDEDPSDVHPAPEAQLEQPPRNRASLSEIRVCSVSSPVVKEDAVSGQPDCPCDGSDGKGTEGKRTQRGESRHADPDRCAGTLPSTLRPCVASTFFVYY